MHKTPPVVVAALALSTVAFAQQDGFYQIGYAANLNISDSVINLSNDGWQGGLAGATPFATEGNVCVNAYIFDPVEEEIACCASLVTPNGLSSVSAQADLISNLLTPAIPTSILVKLVASEPGFAAGAFNTCNPTTVTTNLANVAATPYCAAAPTPGTDPDAGFLVSHGMLAWGATLEPASTPGTYSPVVAPFLAGTLSASELSSLVSSCNSIQSDGTGFGLCKLGAGGGTQSITLEVDGGTFAAEVGYPSGEATAYFLNRLTPPAYLATIQGVEIYFSQDSYSLALGTPINIFSATNPGGSTTLAFGATPDQVSGTVSAFGTFISYTVPQRTITSGDFVVGFEVQNPPNILPAALDQTTPSRGRSYASSDGVDFTVIDIFGPPVAGNLAIRAVVTVPQ